MRKIDRLINEIDKAKAEVPETPSIYLKPLKAVFGEEGLTLTCHEQEKSIYLTRQQAIDLSAWLSDLCAEEAP